MLAQLVVALQKKVSATDPPAPIENVTGAPDVSATLTALEYAPPPPPPPPLPGLPPTLEPVPPGPIVSIELSLLFQFDGGTQEPAPTVVR
jgi:hypothetical protein